MLSAVVISKNRLPYLALKIQSTLYQVNRKCLDILVVDYSDNTDVVDYCRRMNVRCIRVKGEFNISEARNVGIRYSKSKWICISGNDTIVDKNYFAKLCGLIQAYRDQKVFFLGSYTNLVQNCYSLIQKRLISLSLKMRDSSSGDTHSTCLQKVLAVLRRSIISALLVKTSYKGTGSIESISLKKILRALLNLPLVRGITQPAMSLVLLHHLLDRALGADNCLETFHDPIFCETFRHGKIIIPSTFQCFTREMAEALNGYDESLSGWGGEDDDFIMRARFLGYRCVLSQLLSIHLDHRTDWGLRRHHNSENIKIIKSRNVISQPTWGLNCSSQEIC
jgi:glycosyltransferase involved in cell wall biosynthesis